MKTALVIIAATVFTYGFITLGGDKVRGEKGQGEVHQEMVNENHSW